MKKILLSIAFVSALSSVSAQTEPVEGTDSGIDRSFNRWSIELNGGLNKPQRPFTPGYYTATPSPWNADLGVRYMFNPKFGIKGDIGYYNFSEGKESAEFTTHYYRADLQLVANLGRIMNFESWTQRVGLLAHAGGGYAQMKSDDRAFTDRMGNFIIGLTGQIKLSDRVALTGDLTSITNLKQSVNFDGAAANTTGRGFDGGIFTGTVGLTFYLGSHSRHADWYADSDQMQEEIDELNRRIGEIETLMNDSDKDGVPDYLDAEPNSLAGVAVDSKGRTIDRNNNGVPDELESYLEKTYGDAAKGGVANTADNNALVKALINDGYVTTYFDFNKSTPTNVSTEGIDFMLTYLRNNPNASIDIIGHADEIGRSAYNDKLSQARANNVKNILTKAGIAASRLNVVPAGEDSSVDKDSAGARKLVRRVTFKVK
jgi:OOP family OmpA-OmpF porin